VIDCFSHFGHCRFDLYFAEVFFIGIIRKSLSAGQILPFSNIISVTLVDVFERNISVEIKSLWLGSRLRKFWDFGESDTIENLLPLFLTPLILG
jgi:hypothetical protein